MARKVFISYASEDNAKMKVLKRTIEEKFKRKYEVIIVADRKEPGKPLTTKVMNGLKESHIFIPILTSNSIKNQWVNQEIGYATAINIYDEIDKIKIFPIVDKKIENKLKGFIHKQLDLSFSFIANASSSQKKQPSYKKCCAEVCQHLRSLMPKKKVKIKDTFLHQQVSYESLLAYANRRYKDFKHDDHRINNLLWRDLNKNKYKILKDIDQVVTKAEPAVDAYYKDNPPAFDSGTDFLTKSFGFIDVDFRQKHPFSNETRKAFEKYSNLIK